MNGIRALVRAVAVECQQSMFFSSIDTFVCAMSINAFRQGITLIEGTIATFINIDTGCAIANETIGALTFE